VTPAPRSADRIDQRPEFPRFGLAGSSFTCPITQL
jgi:hypothetical protein